MILKPITKERVKILTTRGVSAGDMLHGRDEYNVRENIVKYDTDIPKMMPKIVSAVKQFRNLEKIAENPISSNYVLAISSFPSDARAKQLAIYLMNKGIDMWYKRHKPGRGLPLWHKVYGGYADTLRDKSVEEIPSMLIISNLNSDSTGIKIEKARDLLEKYDGIPRIIVLGGNQDPISFFATRLFYPINVGLLLGPTNREIESV